MVKGRDSNAWLTITLFGERRKVAVNKEESCFEQRCAEKSTLEAESRNETITDKDYLTLIAKVSRKGRE